MDSFASNELRSMTFLFCSLAGLCIHCLWSLFPDGYEKKNSIHLGNFLSLGLSQDWL